MKNTYTLLLLLAVCTIGNSQNTFKIAANNVKILGAGNLVLKNTQWVNNGTFDAGTATVVLTGDGSNAQSVIRGTSPTTFYNLMINKTANGVQLNQMIQVDNQLQMVAGNLYLNNNDLRLGDANGHIFGESVSSFIYGTTGGEIIKTLDLNAPNSANPGNMGAVITSASNLESTTIYRGHSVQNVNGEVSIRRYYDIEPTVNTGLDATLRFYYWNHELNSIPEENLALFELQNTSWSDFTTNAADLNNNYVEATNIDAFNFWTLANIAAALPAELLYFNGNLRNDNKVSLEWKTTSETSNKGFEVQRATNNTSWEIIAWVDGMGTTSDEQTYDLLDTNPHLGLNFYRLKQIDFDGHFEYSNIIAITTGNRNSGLDVYPNPTLGALNFNTPIEGQLSVRDELGRVIWQQNNATAIQHLDLSFLVPATYFLENVNSAGQVNAVKFIIAN